VVIQLKKSVDASDFKVYRVLSVSLRPIFMVDRVRLLSQPSQLAHLLVGGSGWSSEECSPPMLRKSKTHLPSSADVILRTTWRATLWVFSGLAAAIAITSFVFVPPDVLQTVDKRIDWVGAALVTVGLILLQFVISDGQNAPHGWKTGCKRTIFFWGFI